MSEIAPAQQPAEKATPNVDSAASSKNWDKIIDVLAPHAPEVIERGFKLGEGALATAKEAIAASSQAHARTTHMAGLMLATIVASLALLAGWCVYLGKVETAEKIVIALVSFLGGTAFFGGAGKR
jgi:hypothetical protein